MLQCQPRLHKVPSCQLQPTWTEDDWGDDTVATNLLPGMMVTCTTDQALCSYLQLLVSSLPGQGPLRRRCQRAALASWYCKKRCKSQGARPSCQTECMAGELQKFKIWLQAENQPFWWACRTLWSWLWQVQRSAAHPPHGKRLNEYVSVLENERLLMENGNIWLRVKNLYPYSIEKLLCWQMRIHPKKRNSIIAYNGTS
jgi:hypothetical protein